MLPLLSMRSYGVQIEQRIPLHSIHLHVPRIQRPSNLHLSDNTLPGLTPSTGTMLRWFATRGFVAKNSKWSYDTGTTYRGQILLKAVINSGGLPPSESEIAQLLKHKGRHGLLDDVGRDSAAKSIEDTLGLLKEQVEEDKRKRLQGTIGELHPDNRKVLKRSKVLAKQLISQSSASVIGFVSQLWVSAGHFKVVALEVRPSLLSGEHDGVLLDDVCQVGDVVLVGDESVLENEMTFRESETLVGYDLLTENGNYLGKVRDFSFNLHDGKVTSLEFDSLGFSVIPSSVISTYWLGAEEVIEVLSDSIVICHGAESRFRRLSKGLWQLRIEQKKTHNMKLRRKGSRREPLGSENINSRQLPSTNLSLLKSVEFERIDRNVELEDHQQF